MHLSCDCTVNGGNERCNAYFFDSVGFCRKFLVRFLQVVGILGGPEIPITLFWRCSAGGIGESFELIGGD